MPAATDHEHEAAHAGLEISEHAFGGATGGSLVGPGEQHDHLGARVEIALRQHGHGARDRRARRARGDRPQPCAPALLRRSLRMGVRDQDRGTTLEVAQAHLARGGEHLLAATDLARQNRGDEHRRRLLRRQLGRADAFDL